MKDYSHLKGEKVEVDCPYGHEYEDCFVAHIEDKGLTVMGIIKSIKGKPNSPNIGRQVKVFCLRNEIPEHKKLFPFTVELIEKGQPIGVEDAKRAGVDIPRSFGGEPICAFE